MAAVTHARDSMVDAWSRTNPVIVIKSQIHGGRQHALEEREKMNHSCSTWMMGSKNGRPLVGAVEDPDLFIICGALSAIQHYSHARPVTYVALGQI